MLLVSARSRTPKPREYLRLRVCILGDAYSSVRMYVAIPPPTEGMWSRRGYIRSIAPARKNTRISPPNRLEVSRTSAVDAAVETESPGFRFRRKPNTANYRRNARSFQIFRFGFAGIGDGASVGAHSRTSEHKPPFELQESQQKSSE